MSASDPAQGSVSPADERLTQDDSEADGKTAGATVELAQPFRANLMPVIGIFAALGVWMLYHLIGMIYSAPDTRTGFLKAAIVLGCFAGFFSIWLVALGRRAGTATAGSSCVPHRISDSEASFGSPDRPALRARGPLVSSTPS